VFAAAPRADAPPSLPYAANDARSDAFGGAMDDPLGVLANIKAALTSFIASDAPATKEFSDKHKRSVQSEACMAARGPLAVMQEMWIAKGINVAIKKRLQEGWLKHNEHARTFADSVRAEAK
jgi:hypothetical protein